MSSWFTCCYNYWGVPCAATCVRGRVDQEILTTAKNAYDAEFQKAGKKAASRAAPAEQSSQAGRQASQGWKPKHWAPKKCAVRFPATGRACASCLQLCVCQEAVGKTQAVRVLCSLPFTLSLHLCLQVAVRGQWGKRGGKGAGKKGQW